MHRRAFITSALSPLLLPLSCKEQRDVAVPSGPPDAAEPAERARVLDAMKRATRFMTERASYRGGYLWAYLPDFSRSWGELEARRSMIWMQPPGTPTVGHLLLDALHATGDEFYLHAATEVAGALIAAQHKSGGWNYVYDFAGEESLGQWYDTVARNAWRMEEFQYHPDNSTFDDACTGEATQFLLRLRLEPAFASRPQAVAVAAALDRALRLLALSQYPNGGWPQRFPPAPPEYSRFVTFNDDVLAENVRTLLMCHTALAATGVLAPMRAAMDCVVSMQQPLPQAGWGLQHDLEGKPVAARSYEPAALVTHTTAANIELLLGFHELTGDAKYTRRVPEALDWLERVKLAPEQAREYGGTHPTFIEVGSGDPLYVHRRGSNVVNGAYYVDKTFAPRLSHYSPVRRLDLEGLRARLADLRSRPVPLAPLLPERAGSVPLPRYFSLAAPTLRELCTGSAPVQPVPREHALGLVAELDGEGRWLAPLELVSNAYRGPGSRAPYPDATYASTNVGDRSDTSPYWLAAAPSGYATDGLGPDTAPIGISVRRFLHNMGTLIAYLSSPA